MLLRENAPLREYCSMRVGGPAKLAAFPETAEELASLLRAGGRRVVLGGGSNVLFPDEGYDGTVIFTTKLCRLSADGCVLSAQAGVTLSALARKALGCGLGGLAFAYGIPGTVGGGVYMNAAPTAGRLPTVWNARPCWTIRARCSSCPLPSWRSAIEAVR